MGALKEMPQLKELRLFNNHLTEAGIRVIREAAGPGVDLPNLDEQRPSLPEEHLATEESAVQRARAARSCEQRLQIAQQRMGWRVTAEGWRDVDCSCAEEVVGVHGLRSARTHRWCVMFRFHSC